jgi:hypothetical protein
MLRVERFYPFSATPHPGQSALLPSKEDVSISHFKKFTKHKHKQKDPEYL